MLDGAPAENFRRAVFLCVRSLDFAIGILINNFFSVQGFQLAMGKNDNSNSHGRQFRCSPWKVSKLVFPWAAFLNPTMEKLKNTIYMDEYPGFNHGKLEKINFHGQIFPLSPWKNPLNHFPWTETGSCSMEI